MAISDFFSGNKKEKYRYKLTVFLICLAISAFIWMLIKLSEQYTSEITIPVKYSSIPEGKILVNNVDTTIRIGVTEQGFSLAWLKYFKKKEPLFINLQDYRLRQHMHEYVTLVGTDTWAQEFHDQYDIGGDVDYIHPDTISFYFEDRYSKEVPVEPDIDIKYKKQYFAYDTLTFEPKKATISGLYKNISKIKTISTEPIRYNNLSESIDTKVPLKIPEGYPDMKVTPEEISITMKVEKYTESQIEIPITETQVPENQRVKIFPDVVNITYLVALKDFKNVTKEMFSCKVDLSQVSTAGDGKLEVELSAYPQFIRIVSIKPAEVDYLLLK